MKVNLTSVGLVVLTGLMCWACSDAPLNETGLVSIDVVSVLDEDNKLLASDFFDELSYVPLETSEQTMARFIQGVSPLGDSALLVQGFRKIVIYDQTTGDFIKEIGHYGDDPNGYRATMRYYGVDRYRATTFALGNRNNFVEYSLQSGQIIDQLQKPKPDDYKPFENEIVLGSITRLDSVNFLGYTKNFNGKQKNRLVVFKRDGEIVRTYPNYLTYVDDPGKVVSLGPQEGSFFRYKGEVFFKEYYNDTTYRVDMNDMSPVYRFELGRYSPPYAEKESQTYEERQEFIIIKDFIRSKDHLFFSFDFKGEFFVAAYSFKEDRVVVSNTELEGVEGRHGIENDIDGFISFYPTVLENGYMFGLTSAEEAHAWFEQNPDKISELPDSLQAYKDIQPEDNPIVVIGRLK